MGAYRQIHRELAQVDQWRAGEHVRVDQEADAKRRAISVGLGPVQEKQRAIAEARGQAILVAAAWVSVRDAIAKDEAVNSLRGMPPWDQLAAM